MRQSLSSADHYGVAWIAALYIERAAATLLLDERHNPPRDFKQPSSDINSYSWGRMGEHNIVIASLPDAEYGTVSAARTVSHLVTTLPHIRVGLLVGIGGGVPQLDPDFDIRLGDVVVSRPEGTSGGVVQYDLGKEKTGDVWELKGSLNAPPLVLLGALANLRAEHELSSSSIPTILERLSTVKKPELWKYQGAEHDRLFQDNYPHSANKTCENCDSSNEVPRPQRCSVDPEIHYGVIASGDKLVKDTVTRNKVADIVGDKCLCIETEAAGLMREFPCLVIRGICDYADSHKNDRWQRYASATAAAFAKELLGYLAPQQLSQTRYVSEVLESLKNVEHATRNTAQGVQKLQVNIEDSALRKALDSLDIAKGASFDSYDEEPNPKCLNGTRVELLNEINKWAMDPNSKSIFWLKGKAGTGKSTISRTLCSDFNQLGYLGASFFFKRGESDRGNIRKVFATIAKQLATRYQKLATDIKKAIHDDHGNKGSRQQFLNLVLNPVKERIDLSKDKSILLLIDALDEIEQETEIEQLISLLALSQGTALKVFITSRPEPAVIRGFLSIKDKYQEIILDQVPLSLIKRDLRLYLEREMVLIRHQCNESFREGSNDQLREEWPSKSDFEKLVEMAVPLFIFAATVCRFLRQRAYGSPKTLLQEVLQFQTKDHVSDLDPAYLPVLRNLLKSFSTGQKRHQRRQIVIQLFQDIIGPIIILASPLSIRSLANLLDISIASITSILSQLHSVLEVPQSENQPVRLLHLSFRDFLLDSNIEEKDLFINETLAHRNMATKCIRTMDFLREDMCDLRQFGNEDAIIDQEEVAKYIPPEVRYACLYWVSHFQSAKNEMGSLNDVAEFLTSHFLHWIEALSLMRQTEGGLSMLQQLVVLSSEKGNHALTAMLNDAVRIFQYNAAVISAAPLQLYSSVLMFAPRSNVVRHMFEKDRSKWIKSVSGIDEDWDSCLFKIEDRISHCGIVAFSHDDSLVISSSGNHAFRLSRTDTGACVGRLEDHNSPMRSVSFSHDSSLIASVSESGEMRLWQTKTGECLYVFVHAVSDGNDENDEDDIPSLKNDNAKNEASIDHWTDAKTSKSTTGMDNKYYPIIQCVIFSHDSSLLVSVFESQYLNQPFRRIWLWRTDTRELIRSIDGSFSGNCTVSFSRDNDLLVVSTTTAAEAIQGQIWKFNEHHSVKMHTLYMPLREETDAFNELVELSISTDGSLVALVLGDGTVWLWQVETGEPMQKLDWKNMRISDFSLAIAPDSSFVALLAREVNFKYSDHVWLWRTKTGTSVTMDPLEVPEIGFSPACASLVFSHDSLVLAATTQHSIQLWRTDTGALIHVFQDRCAQSLASANSKSLIACVSSDGVRLWRHSLNAHRSSNQQDQLDIHEIRLLRLSHDASTAAWMHRGSLRLWSTDTGRCLGVASITYDPSIDCAFSSDDSRIAAEGPDGNLRLWNAHDMSLVCILVNNEDRAITATFSQDDRLVASGGEFTVKLWTTDKSGTNLWKPSNTLYIGSPKYDSVVFHIHALAFSSDSRFIAAYRRNPLAHSEDSIKLWDVDSRQCVWNITCSEPPFSSIAFTPGGSRLACIQRTDVLFLAADTGEHTQTINLGEQHPFLSFEDVYNSLADVNLFLRQDIDHISKFHGYGLSKDQCWITWNGSNLLWLPVNYRPKRAATDGRTVVFVCESGRLVVIRLDDYSAWLGRIKRKLDMAKQESRDSQSMDIGRKVRTV